MTRTPGCLLADRAPVFSAANLKLIHVGTVVLTVVGFFARGLGAFAESAWIGWRATRLTKDAVDTLLLASAVGLAYRLKVSPLSSPWLAAKIVGLLLYMALGVVALRPGLARPARLAALVGALAVFAYIVSVALTKSPLGLLRPLLGA